MKVRITRTFTYQASSSKVVSVEPGEVDLPKRLALAALKQRRAVRIEAEKPAKVDTKKPTPENKAAKPAKNKSGVGRKAKRRSRTGAKSK